MVIDLAATCQAGMVIKTDPPARQASPATPAPAAQQPSPARTSGKTGGQADGSGWPACIRQLNAAALSEHWDAERRQALLEQCP